MPIRNAVNPNVTPQSGTPIFQPEQITAPQGGVMGAALRSANFPYQIHQLYQVPDNELEDQFDLRSYLDTEAPELIEPYWREFVGIRNSARARYEIEQIRSREQDQIILQSNGVVGLAASIVASLFDPTIFIPMANAARAANIGRAAGRAAVETGAIVAAQEPFFQFADPTRTPADAAFSIGGATILGGLLGGAARALSRPDFERISEELIVGAVRQENLTESVLGEPNGLGTVSSVGAAASRVDPGGLAPTFGMARVVRPTNPVLRVLDGPFEVGRNAMARLSTAGIRTQAMEQGIVVPRMGSTVEMNARVYQGRLARAIQEVEGLYQRYYFETDEKRLLGQTRAWAGGEIKARFGSGDGKLSASQFRQEVFNALENEDQHFIPEVASAAQAYRRDVYDPLFKEAVASGLLPEDLDVRGALSYANRVYNVDQIIAEPEKFANLVAEHLKRKVTAGFEKQVKNFAQRQQARRQELDDLGMPAERRAETVDQLQNRLRQLQGEETPTPELYAAQPGLRKALQLVEQRNALMELRREARQAKNVGLINRLTDDLKKLDKSKAWREYRKQVNAVTRRLRNLELGNLPVRRLEIEQRLQEVEDAAARQFDRVVKRATRLESQAAEMTDEVFQQQVAILVDDVYKLNAQFRRIANRSKNTARSQAQLARGERLNKKLDELQELRGLDRGEIIEEIAGARAELRHNYDDMVVDRAERKQKIMREMADATPELFAQNLAAKQKAITDAELDFMSRWRTKADDIDLETGRATFDEYAYSSAVELRDKIRGTTPGRVPGLDLLQDARGAELMRTLDIDLKEFPEFAQFLERDVDKLARIYHRTYAPDIALQKEFGSVTLTEEFAQLRDEFNARSRAIDARQPPTEAELKGLNYLQRQALNEGATAEGKKKAQQTLMTEYKNTKEDLEAAIGRLRHNYALPADPYSLGNRLAQAAMQLNYLRYMGGVTLSSIPDLANPILHYGVTRAFKPGFKALFEGLQEIKITSREAQLAGAANELTLETRAHALADVFTEGYSNSRLGSLLDIMSNKMGVLSLGAHWNQTTKLWVGNIAITKLVDDAGAVARGTATPEQLGFLVSVGIDETSARAIWRQVTEVPNGGQKFKNNVWLPNTENWTDDRIRNLFRSAIVNETDRVIITPGIDRPLMFSNFMGSPALGRLIGQFRSFTFSSTSRMLLAGLQRRDLNTVQGVIALPFFGAVAYWATSMAAGGDRQTEMQNASFAKWAVEGVDRSGMLTVFAEANRLAERAGLPALSDLTGETPTRARAESVYGTALGPSTDLAIRAARVMMDVAQMEPDQNTLRNARLLLPYQNLFYLRQSLDKVEQGAGTIMGLE